VGTSGPVDLAANPSDLGDVKRLRLLERLQEPLGILDIVTISPELLDELALLGEVPLALHGVVLSLSEVLDEELAIHGAI
jgi:hypothetical protein